MNTINPFPIPILFIVFNRPEVTGRVFETIRTIRPQILYIAADGPRDLPGEKEKCDRTRLILANIDWECEVKTFLRDRNAGCKLSVSSAIAWFFDTVEAGIILEDDCQPSLEFFPFAEKLLDRFRNDTRIGFISGTNYLCQVDDCHSYFFSHQRPIWGWATWRRAWERYDIEMKDWPEFKKHDYLSMAIKNRDFVDFYSGIYDAMYEKRIDTWDHQWSFTCLRENWLTIIPTVNLVSNIGFSVEATHTKESNNPLANIPIQPMNINDMCHPKIIMPNPIHEDALEKLILTIMTHTSQKERIFSIIRKAKTWLKDLL